MNLHNIPNTMVIAEENKSRKKRKSKASKITFDDEILIKDAAAKVIEDKRFNESNQLSQSKKTMRSVSQTENYNKPVNHLSSKIKAKHKHKQAKNSDSFNKKIINKPTNNSFNDPTSNSSKNEDHETINVNNNSSNPEIEVSTGILNSDNSTHKKEESIRARKRRCHMELLEEKKIRSELNLQQKCLNYLSMWKHSKSQWKFEKLKQIWLQQNMFDDTKIPVECWDTLVEYFNNAKGQAKTNILTEALKIMESMQHSEGEKVEETSMKYIRARSIVQNLQE